MGKKTNTPLVLKAGFDYQSLKPTEAEKLRKAAERVREKINKSVRTLVEVGQDLLAAQHILPRGEFVPWVKAEFDWTYRTARRIMDVAEQFGPNCDIVSHLPIPIPATALYHLAAPSTPFEAREAAINRARVGEEITAAIATEIIRAARKKAPPKGRALQLDRFSRGLKLVLKRFRDRCEPDKVLEYARQLHQFASELEKESRAAIGLAPSLADRTASDETRTNHFTKTGKDRWGEAIANVR